MMKFLDYIKGSRKGVDAHDIELKAMNDPFLADAIDGYDSIMSNHMGNIVALQNNVSLQTSSERKGTGLSKLVAAAVIFIALIFGYFYKSNYNSTMLVAESDKPASEIYQPNSENSNNNSALSYAAETDGNADSKEQASTTNISDSEKATGKSEIPLAVESVEESMPTENIEYKDVILSKESNKIVAEKKVESYSDSYYQTDNETAVDKVDAVSPVMEKPIYDKSNVATPDNSQTLVLGEVAMSQSENSPVQDKRASLATARKERKGAKPEPVIGYKKYKTYIKENMVAIFDPACKENETFGTVVLSFDVSAQGRPINIQVEKGLCEPYNKEAIRLLKEGPDWTSVPARGQLEIYFKHE